MLVLALLLTAWIAVHWGALKMLNQDEMFVMQTDSVPTLAEVLHIQLHYPISLDPMVYHALAHLSTSLFGATAFALRLPSLLGYMLMQVCLYFFVRRATRDHLGEQQSGVAATVAAIFPLATATLYYAVEARPYGLLLGLYALALVAWQAATRSEQTRRWSLPLLALAVGLALNTHYFAVLLLPVLYLAELVRTLDRRKLDTALVAALVLGTACFGLTLPFQKAAKVFRLHYYNAGTISVRAVSEAYRSLLFDYTWTSTQTQRILALVFVVVMLAFLFSLYRGWASLKLPRAESALLIALFALPILGFLLAHFVTHSYEVRYVLGAIISISLLFSLWLAPLLKSETAHQAAISILGFVILVAVLHETSLERMKSRAMMQSLEVPAAVRAALAADPTHNLYIQQMGHYEIAQYYQPDAFLRAHTVLVYDAAREIRFSGHDTEALTAEHMLHFTALPIVSYDKLRQSTAAQDWVAYDSGWDFTADAFAEDHAQSSPLAPFFEGTVLSVHFPAMVNSNTQAVSAGQGQRP